MPLGDVLQMLQIVSGIDAQRKQQALAARQQAQGAYGDFTKIVGTIRDPGARSQFISSYAQQTGIDPAALTQIAANQEPSVASTNAELQQDYVRGLQSPDFAASQTPDYMQYAHQVGAQAGTGQGIGELAHQTATEATFQHLLDKKGPFADALRKEFDARTAAGMSAGNAMVDTALANLPGSQQTQAARMGAGLQLSAGQVQSGNLERSSQQLQAGIAGAAQNSRDREIAQQGVIGAAAIDQRAQAAELRSAAQKSALDEARKRLITNVESLTKNAHTGAGSKLLTQQIQGDYDLLYGPGAFRVDYGINPTFDPGTLAKIGRTLGL